MKSKRNGAVIVSIVFSVFIFLFLSGTVTSGYHFVDDHEIIKMKNDLKSFSLIDVATNWVKDDINNNARFRPLYYIHRVFETKLLGSDFFLWSVYNGVLFCLTLILCYLGMRNMEFSPGESIVFLIITFIGPQISILWRLGPSEGLGMVFMSFSFYFISKSFEKKHYISNNLLIILFLILTSLTKESFLIIIPAMIFFKIWNENNYIWHSLKESVCRNLILIVPLIVMIVELYIIKYHVGTGYSGLSANYIDNLYIIWYAGLHFLKSYLNLIIVALLLLAISYFIKKSIRGFDLFSFVFFILIIAPNLVLYAKTGLMERYLLPSSFGLAFLVVTYVNKIEENPAWYKRMALTIIIISFLPFFIKSIADARDFSNEGIATNKLLSGISTNYVDRSKALVIVDPVELYEKSVSLKNYLFYENKIDLFGYCIVRNGKTENSQSYIDGWKSYFKGRLFEDMTSKPELLIFLDKKMVDEFFKTSALLRKDYLPIEIGNSPFALLKEIVY